MTTRRLPMRSCRTRRRVELVRSRLAKCPPCAPLAEVVDDPLQRAPGSGQAIFGPLAARRDPPLDHARLLQPAEALGEQRARDAGQAALELVEVADVGQELAHDQHRPAIGEDLGRARHRTVLAV
jgi:hypothetical protein